MYSPPGLHRPLLIIIIIIINGTLARSLEPVVTECKEHTISLHGVSNANNARPITLLTIRGVLNMLFFCLFLRQITI